MTVARPRRPRVRALLTGGALLLVAACTGESGSPPEPEAAPSAGSPPPSAASVAPDGQVPDGTCWPAQDPADVDRVSLDLAPVPCTEPHGAATVATLDVTRYAAALRPIVRAGRTRSPEERVVVQASAVGCLAAGAQARAPLAVDVDDRSVVDATRVAALTDLAVLPTPAQWRRGARWLRCDLTPRGAGPLTGPPRTLPSLGWDLDDLATDPLPEALRLCVDQRGQDAVACDDDAAYEVALALTLRRPSSPRAAGRVCGRVLDGVEVRALAQPPGGFVRGRVWCALSRP